jgi:hypothetical protein
MTENEFWTDSQRDAWKYVLSAQDEGLSQTGAVRQYRDAGGSIRNESWGELWHRAAEGRSSWDNLYRLKASDTVPESMFTQVGINYNQKYVMTFTSTIRDEYGNILHGIQRQVESNRRLTLSEWQANANQAMMEDTSVIALEVYSVEDVAFYERMD